MKKIITHYFELTKRLTTLSFVPLLLIRLVLAYGFYEPAMSKFKDISAIAAWFDSLGLVFPTFQAYLATYTELLGVILLVLGLGVRFISIPLIITMLVAVKTVHFANGFSAGDNGYEIPLYYIIMLLVLLFHGGGKIGLDYLLERKITKKSNA